MKNIRLIVLIVLVLASSAILLYSEFMKPMGVVVTSVGSDSPCKNTIIVGSVITEIAGRSIRNSDDFNKITKDIEGTITLMINNNPRSCTIPKNSTLDVTVENLKDEGLKLGIEIGGGTYYSLNPEDEVSQKTLQEMLNILKSRVKNYGLSNTRVDVINGSIRIVMGPEEKIYFNLLTEQGILEGKLPQTIEFKDKKGNFTFNDKTYEIVLKDSKSVLIDDSEYTIGQYFTLDEVKFEIKNITSNATTFLINVFNDEDLTLIKDSPTVGSARIVKQAGGYVFVVPVQLSEEASENFAKATKGQEVIISPTTGESFLKNPLTISIDENAFIDLPISGTDAGKEKKNLIIWGYKSTMKEATDDKLRLISILEFKKLPTKLVLIETGSFQPTKGELFISLLLYTVLIASVVVSILFFVRYRKRGIMVLPLILVSLSVIILILGVISTRWFVLLIFFLGVGLIVSKSEIQIWMSWLSLFLMFIMVVGTVMSKWVLDAHSIVGLIFVILFSIGRAVFAGDRFLTNKEPYSIAGYKRSLRITWLSTTVVTLILLPLFFVGGFLKSFAMTAIVGILISTTITEPAYVNMIERVCK